MNNNFIPEELDAIFKIFKDKFKDIFNFTD